MRSWLQKSLALLQFDFRQAKLSWVLAAINVLLVILVVGGIAVSAVGLLRQLADNQGLARVQLAGAMAREELRRLSEDTLTAARGLAARPTLRRLADEDTQNAIELFLRRACQAANADVCVLAQGNRVLAQSAAAPWKEILDAHIEQGERFMVAPPAPAAPLLGAVAQIEGDLHVYVLRFFDDKLAARLTERAGLDVQLVSYRTFAATVSDAFAQLHSAALSDGRSAAARISDENVFASSIPVFASTGEAIALIDTRLATAELDESVNVLVRRLWVTALTLGALAVLVAVWLGRQVVGPIRQLTEAAARLGQGDFSTSIPVHGAAEVGVLARTMEDMRRNLVGLTGTLRRREAEAQAVLNGVVEGVFAVDKQRNIAYLNNQAARMLGLAAQDAIGRFCGDVLKPGKNAGVRPCESQCPILQAREIGSARAVEHLESTPGSPRHVVVTSAAPVDGLQVQVLRDETELEAVRRARDSVLANISHEFRTPLTAQLASIELLRESLETRNSEQQRELVMSLERGTHRLARLIDNLLESVRIESGQLAIRRQTLTVRELIDDARQLLGSLFELRRQRLEVVVPDELPTLEGDAPRLTQVLVNLLSNANKYAPEGSTVRIGAAADAANVAIWVEDEGPGVSAAAAGSIFDRFSRGKGEEPEPGGLGLGLWIVKSIVERHGGQVSAERTADGRTRFTVSLPRNGGVIERDNDPVSSLPPSSS